MSDRSRRQLLKVLAAAGAGAAVLGGGRPFAQDRRGGNRIDVHHHIPDPVPHQPGGRWSPEIALEQMGRHGISQSILSYVSGRVELYTPPQQARAFARRVNEYGAQLVSDRPRQFGFFGVLPLHDVEGSLKEIEYALDVLKVDGFAMHSNTGVKWLGDPLLLPIFQELHRRKSIVFIHPNVNACCQKLIAGIPDTAIEVDFDTTRAVTSLVYNGILSQCPDVRVIVNHFGAAGPALAGRIKDRVPGANTNQPNREGRTERTPNGVMYELQKLYYECAHAAYAMPWAATMALVPPTQILFGTDYPAEPMAGTIDELRQRNVTPDVLFALERGNAERLIPRLKA